MRKESAPRLLFLTLVFSPDGVSTATILSQLAQSLSERGEEIAVVTTTPHYNEDEEARRVQPLTNSWLGVLYKSRVGSIRVYHVRMRRKGSRVLGRLLDYAVFHALSGVVTVVVGQRYDILFVPSPPLTIGLEAVVVAAFLGVPFVYNVQEIYPDIAVKLGVLRNRLLIRVLERVERYIYARAAAVTVISDRFRDRLLEKGVPPEKLRMISNFVDTEFTRPLPQDNALSRRLRLAGKFVVLYAGNLGLTQDFEILLGAAERLRELPDLVFLIVGDGARSSWLAAEVSARENVRLLPYQTKSAVPELYAASSVCTVPMKVGTAHDTFPSKIYTIMASQRAALVAADVDSELSDVVRRSNCGVAVRPGDLDSFCAALQRMYVDRAQCAAWAASGREYVVRFHSRDAIADQYDRLFREIVSSRSS